MNAISPAVADRISPFVADLKAHPAYRHVLAVVVSGSAARSEEVWSDGCLVSDIDLMIITASPSLRLARSIEAAVSRHRAFGVDGGRIPLGPLRSYRTFAFYEARCNGVVVDGDPSILTRIPAAPSETLPVWEAVRVVGNRLFEHVKLANGDSGPEVAVRKTYESLTEAALCVQGRYRPSYRERRAECLDSALPELAPGLQAKALAAADARLDGRPMEIGIVEARADLLVGFAQVLREYTGVSGLKEGLNRVSELEHHWRHRAYWAALMARGRRWNRIRVREDPIVGLWREAVDALQSGSPSPRLFADWKQCPQILKTDPRSVDTTDSGSARGAASGISRVQRGHP